jgi:hypothetical protein
MRISDLLFLCAAAALPLDAQVVAFSQGWPGVQVRFTSRLEPPPAKTTDPAILRELERELPGSAVALGERVHRIWQDAEQKVYGGYDLSVEKGGGAQTFQLRILPLSLAPKQISATETWTQHSLPKYPVIPEVRVGDTVAIDILANPTTGQKLVDYLTLERTAPAPPPRPHDFTLADAELSVNDPRLSVDGKPVDATAHFAGGVSGPTVWFYLRDHGRFMLSLFGKSDRRFREAGEVYDNILTFRDDAAEYRIECTSRIAPGPGHYNIYVFHNPAWWPMGEGANEPFILGSFPKAWLTGE